jgi:hypothetical protein
MSAVGAVKRDTVSRDEAALPAGGHAEQISVKQHARAIFEANSHSFQGHIFRWDIRADAGGLEGKIVLDSTAASPFGALPGRAGERANCGG